MLVPVLADGSMLVDLVDIERGGAAGSSSASATGGKGLVLRGGDECNCIIRDGGTGLRSGVGDGE